MDNLSQPVQLSSAPSFSLYVPIGHGIHSPGSLREAKYPGEQESSMLYRFSRAHIGVFIFTILKFLFLISDFKYLKCNYLITYSNNRSCFSLLRRLSCNFPDTECTQPRYNRSKRFVVDWGRCPRNMQYRIFADRAWSHVTVEVVVAG